MPATTRITLRTGASGSPTDTNVDSEGGGTGFTWSRVDSQAGSTAIPIPTTSPANAYSYVKTLFLNVTGAASTTLSNRKVYSNGAPATGLYYWYKDGGTSYTQATGPVEADNTSANGTGPAGYTAMAASQGAASSWYATGVSAGATGRNGDYVNLVLGVGGNYTGGGNAATATPSVIVSYDEA